MLPDLDYERLLPVTICCSYFRAYKSCIGPATTMTNVFFGMNVLSLPYGVVNKSLINPYMNFQAHGHQPLPYKLVATPCIGFMEEFRKYMPAKSIRRKFRGIGNVWWDDPDTRSASLSALLCPAIIATLNTAKTSEHSLAVLALSAFMEEFQKQSEIPCAWGVTERQLWLEIKVCPFCLGRDVPCLIFLGVLEGYMGWLRDSSFSFQPSLQINPTQSSFHRMVFDIV